MVDAMPVESLIDAPIEAVDAFQLLICLKVATDRTSRPPLEISMDPISLKDKVVSMAPLFESSGVIDFSSLVLEKRNVRDIVISFLTVLELARLRFIEIIQTEAFGPIQLRRIRALRELNVGLLDQF
jgi:segregation and condensation protein A